MNTVADAPVPGLVPELPVQPAAAAVPNPGKSTTRRVKDTLVAIYAYGLLAFGVLFPLLLAAWAAFFMPDAQ